MFIIKELYNFVKFVYIYLVHCNSQVCSSLAVAGRPLTLSCQRRLYLHLSKTGQHFSSAISLRFYLLLKSLVVGGLPCSLEFRGFPAKHPLSKRLGQVFTVHHAKPITDTNLLLFHHALSILFFLLSHRTACCSRLLFRLYSFRD